MPPVQQHATITPEQQAQVEAEVERLLAAGEWREHVDERSGRKYYSQKATKQVVWNLVKHIAQAAFGLAVPPPSKKQQQQQQSGAATAGAQKKPAAAAPVRRTAPAATASTTKKEPVVTSPVRAAAPGSSSTNSNAIGDLPLSPISAVPDDSVATSSQRSTPVAPTTASASAARPAAAAAVPSRSGGDAAAPPPSLPPPPKPKAPPPLLSPKSAASSSSSVASPLAAQLAAAAAKRSNMATPNPPSGAPSPLPPPSKKAPPSPSTPLVMTPRAGTTPPSRASADAPPQLVVSSPARVSPVSAAVAVASGAGAPPLTRPMPLSVASGGDAGVATGRKSPSLSGSGVVGAELSSSGRVPVKDIVERLSRPTSPDPGAGTNGGTRSVGGDGRTSTGGSNDADRRQSAVVQQAPAASSSPAAAAPPTTSATVTGATHHQAASATSFIDGPRRAFKAPPQPPLGKTAPATSAQADSSSSEQQQQRASAVKSPVRATSRPRQVTPPTRQQQIVGRSPPSRSARHKSPARPTSPRAPTEPTTATVAPRQRELVNEDPAFRQACLKALFDRSSGSSGNKAKAWVRHEAAMPALVGLSGEFPRVMLPQLMMSGDGGGKVWVHDCFFMSGTQRPVRGVVRLARRSVEVFGWDTSSPTTDGAFERIKPLLNITVPPTAEGTPREDFAIATDEPRTEYDEQPTVRLPTPVLITMCPDTHILTVFSHGAPVAAMRCVGVGSHVPTLPFVDPVSLQRHTQFEDRDLGVVLLVSGAANLLLQHLASHLDAKCASRSHGDEGDHHLVGSPGQHHGSPSSPVGRRPLSPRRVNDESDVHDSTATSAASPQGQRVAAVRKLMRSIITPNRPRGVAADGGWDESKANHDDSNVTTEARKQRRVASAVSSVARFVAEDEERRRFTSPSASMTAATPRRTTTTARSKAAPGRTPAASNNSSSVGAGRGGGTATRAWQRHADPAILDEAYRAALRRGFPQAAELWQCRPSHAPQGTRSSAAASSTPRGGATRARQQPSSSARTSSRKTTSDGGGPVYSPSRGDHTLRRPRQYAEKPQPFELQRHAEVAREGVEDDVLAVLAASSLHDASVRLHERHHQGASPSRRTGEAGRAREAATAAADPPLSGDALNDPTTRRQLLEALIEANRRLDGELEAVGLE